MHLCSADNVLGSLSKAVMEKTQSDNKELALALHSRVKNQTILEQNSSMF